MINQFRSLALNTTPSALLSPYTAYNTHIAPDYASVSLPVDLAELYGVFYPSPNFVSKLQLTHAYMELVHGCGLEDAITALDSRVTYDVRKAKTFIAPRAISVGVPTTAEAQDPAIALRVFNYEYLPAWLDTRLVRTLSIEQQTNTNNIRVYEDAIQVGAQSTLTFSGGFSNAVTVWNPDNSSNRLFDFNIKHPVSPAFTATSGKKWNVTFTIPTLDLISKQMAVCRTKLSSINGVLTRYSASPKAQAYDQLWMTHFNDNFRLAGLFVGMVYRMNALRG